jgi:tryptophan synthase
MGTTGATGTLNSGLGELCRRVHEYSGNTPIAVGFGVSTREHFLSVSEFAEGVVIGSQIVTVLADSEPDHWNERVKAYCQMIVGRDGNDLSTREVGIAESVDKAKETAEAQPTSVISEKDTEPGPGLMDQLNALNIDSEVSPHVGNLTLLS